MAALKQLTAALKPSKILTTVRQALQKEDPMEWFDALQSLKNTAEQVEAKYIKTIAVSTVNTITMACKYSGVVYSEGHPDHEWSLAGPSADDALISYGTTWLEDALSDLYDNALWPIDGCEALVRTSLDIILYDRLKLLSSAGEGIRRLTLQGEYPILTKVTDSSSQGDFLSGQADYAIGHTAGDRLDTAVIAIEAKIPSTFYKAVTQLIIYLAGLQQQRKAERKLICKVYGMAMDGLGFEFFRLDENGNLRSSGRLKFNKPSDKKLIFRFIDHILQTALRESPHATPEKQFPSSVAKWEKKVERPRFRFGDLDEWTMEIIDDEDDTEIVSCGTPSKNAILVKKPPLHASLHSSP